MRKLWRSLAIVAVLVAGGGTLAACQTGNSTPSAVSQEQRTSANDLNQQLQSQPVPTFKWSQIRETLIQLETAQANTTQTTSFFFNQGVTNPIATCPSIGFPLASDTQLTNPQQSEWRYAGDNGVAGATIGQIDPNGVYSGQSTGTYVLCVAPNGTTYVNYWEGFVQTVSGPAVWENGQVKLTGPTTVHIKTAAP